MRVLTFHSFLHWDQIYSLKTFVLYIHCKILPTCFQGAKCFNSESSLSFRLSLSLCMFFLLSTSSTVEFHLEQLRLLLPWATFNPPTHTAKVFIHTKFKSQLQMLYFTLDHLWFSAHPHTQTHTLSLPPIVSHGNFWCSLPFVWSPPWLWLSDFVTCESPVSLCRRSSHAHLTLIRRHWFTPFATHFGPVTGPLHPLTCSSFNSCFTINPNTKGHVDKLFINSH